MIVISKEYPQMADRIRRPDRICTIQDTHHENQPITAPSRQILEVRPNKRIAGISIARLRRHNSTNQSHDNKKCHQHCAHPSEELCQEPLSEKHETEITPSDDKKTDEDLPALWGVIRVVHTVHRNDRICAEEADTGASENPSQCIPPARVEGDYTPILWTGGD